MMSKPVDLILFDIDGTLLQSHKVTRYGMSIALKEVFGGDGPIDQYSMSGKTDPQIMRELMLLNGISDDEINEKLPQACQLYVKIVCESISQFDLHTCVGIPELLRILQRKKHVMLGLLTGNLEGIVEAKLSQAGLWKDIFAVGAFGSDAEDRNLLPKIAISRAEKLLQREIDASLTVLVGDTPRDIGCARAAGTRIMAVATGNYSVEELGEYHPDYLFENFSDPAPALEALELS
ncbi:MAG TPA: HAD family hydrolase [Ktedonobacteraceae bacterium]|nr:HAD family hydrolase [Ktedonobacteraceae bacterium]